MKNKKDFIQFDEEFLENAFKFLNTYYILDIDFNSMFQLSYQEKEKLCRIKKIYSKVKLVKDFKTVQLTYIDKETALSLANNILINILPSKREEIINLNNLIKYNAANTYKAGLEYTMSKDKIECNNISLTNEFSVYDISTIVHEKTHAITFNNLNLVSLYQTGLELFPMLFEKIMLFELQDITADIYNKIIRVNDIKECFFNLDTIEFIEEYSKDKEIARLVYDYFYIKSCDYLISELYSNLLLKYYILDKETMIKRLNALFNQKITIKDFLVSYNINLLNKDLISITKEETDKCKRIMIIP